MIKLLKSNKIVSLFLFIICIIIIIKPLTYAKSFLNGVSIWAIKVLPLLFPFFILSKLIIQLLNSKNVNQFSLKRSFKNNILVFFLSCLSGYPMGAKLILEQYKTGQLNPTKAKTMIAFCSVSGPMFMIGTIGVGFLSSYQAGVVVLISNIVGAICNGLIWNKINKRKKNSNSLNNFQYISAGRKNLSFSDIVYDSLISILMIGAYISISFILIEMFKQLNLLNFLSKFIYYMSFKNIDIVTIDAFLIGLVEITSGIFHLGQTCSSLPIKTILSSFLVSFGGFSILLQHIGILSEMGLSWKYIIKQKLTHSIFSVFIAAMLCFCFLL